MDVLRPPEMHRSSSVKPHTCLATSLVFSAIKVQVTSQYGHPCISQSIGAVLGANLSPSTGMSAPQVFQKLPPSSNLSTAKCVLTTAAFSIPQHLQGCLQKSSARHSRPVSLAVAAACVPTPHDSGVLLISDQRKAARSCLKRQHHKLMDKQLFGLLADYHPHHHLLNPLSSTAKAPAPCVCSGSTRRGVSYHFPWLFLSSETWTGARRKTPANLSQKLSIF